jgi:hypothetical protein
MSLDHILSGLPLVRLRLHGLVVRSVKLGGGAVCLGGRFVRVTCALMGPLSALSGFRRCFLRPASIIGREMFALL